VVSTPLADGEGLVEYFENRGEISAAMTDALREHGEDLFRCEMAQIDRHIRAGEAAEAFAWLVRLASFLNAAMAKDVSLLDRLGEWLKELADKLREVVAAWGAVGFVIGAEARWPPSVYIEVEFGRWTRS